MSINIEAWGSWVRRTDGFYKGHKAFMITEKDMIALKNKLSSPGDKNLKPLLTEARKLLTISSLHDRTGHCKRVADKLEKIL